MSKDVNIDNYMWFYKENDKEEEWAPICREERQYALYLSNVLRYYGKNPDYDKPNYDKISKDEPVNRIENNETVKNIFRACGFNDVDLKNIVIENVYYEATFMRDFFERNRRYYLAVKDGEKPEVEYSKEPFQHEDFIVSTKNSFNYELLVYCSNIINKPPDKTKDQIAESKDKDKDYIIAERNYGGKDNFIIELKPKGSESKKQKINKLNEEGLKILQEINITKVDEEDSKENPKGFEKWNLFKTLVRAMMNAKPDLAIIYKEKDKNDIRKLLFIECKYCSGESYYKYDVYKYDKNNNQTKAVETIRQRAVQGYIAEFLCQFCQGSGYMNGVQVSELMNNKEPKNVNEGEYQSYLVKFVTASAKDGEINIKDLIEIEKDIFDKKK